VFQNPPSVPPVSTDKVCVVFVNVAFLDSILGAPGRPAAKPFREVHQAHGRPFLGVVMGSAPPFVGRPVHEPWAGGKRSEGVVRAVAQSHADSPDASSPPLMGRFQLARVAQPVAVATGEHAPWSGLNKFTCAQEGAGW
jgi:hypothetical protein